MPLVSRHTRGSKQFCLLSFGLVLNCCIYIRPRLCRWKDANPDQSWFWAFKQVLSAAPPPTTARTAHLRSGPIYDRNKGGRPPSSGDTDKLEQAGAGVPDGNAKDLLGEGPTTKTNHDSFSQHNSPEGPVVAVDCEEGPNEEDV